MILSLNLLICDFMFSCVVVLFSLTYLCVMICEFMFLFVGVLISLSYVCVLIYDSMFAFFGPSYTPQGKGESTTPLAGCK